MNKNIAIFGAQQGDEAKGSLSHYLSTDFDWVVRFGGSNNCGHTIYTNGKKYVHNLIPSIDFSNTKTKGFLGSGMVIDPKALLDELLKLEEDFPGVSQKIFVDPDAFVVLSKHIEEDKEKNTHIGSTGKGVSPSYRDKIDRCGIKLSALMHDKINVINDLENLGVRFEYASSIMKELKQSNIIFEGSQSIRLDYNYGSYPYVTSGECGLNGIMSSGFAKIAPTKIYGICKIYETKVGSGPFPTELDGKAADELRERGKEYGAVTKRPRRIGWLDLPALNYAIEKGGITNLIMTKLDILNGMKKIPVCHKYDKQPMSGHDFFSAKPEYIEVNGWEDPRDPNQVKEFINLVQDSTKTKVSMISCGINKSDIINLN